MKCLCGYGADTVLKAQEWCSRRKMQEEEEDAVLPRLSQQCGELTTQTPWWPQTQLRSGHKSELQRSRQYSPCRDLKNTKTRGSLWIICFILFLIRWRWPKLNHIKTEGLERSTSWATLRSNYYLICTIKKWNKISKRINKFKKKSQKYNFWSIGIQEQLRNKVVDYSMFCDFIKTQ